MTNLKEQVAANEHKFWRRLLNTCLLVQDLDPFALYTMHDENRAELHMQPESSSTHNKPKGRLALFTRLFATYFCLKTILLSAAQFSLLSHRFGSDRARSRLIFNLSTSQRLAQFIGNPLESLNDLSILCYVSPSGYAFVCTVLITLYYKRFRPMDNPPLRLLLDPVRELRRIDTRIKYTIGNLEASLDAYRAEQWRQFEMGRSCSSGRSTMVLFKQSQAVKMELEHELMDESLFMEQTGSLLAEFKSRLSPFRPANLTAEHYLKMCTLASFILPVLFVNFILVGVSYGIPFLYLPYASRCAHLDCNPLDVYTVAELILALEIWITICICVLAATRNLSQLILLLFSQLNLIEAINSELVVCRDILFASLIDGRCKSKSREMDNEFRDKHLDSALLNSNKFGDIRRTRSVGHKITSDTTQFRCSKLNSPMSLMKNSRQLSKSQRNRLVLEVLTKLLICNEELGRNSRCISMEVGEQFYYIFGTILVIVSHNLFGIEQTKLARTCIVLVTWLEMNSITISCAYVHSRVLQFRRNLWPLLATALQVYRDCYWPQQRRHRLKSCSFVVDLLTKLVLLASSDLGADCPRVLNLKLNYERIIQANFFVVFVYSFTMQMR